MPKKLHRVEIVLYVMAEDEFEACVAAQQAHFDVFECVAEEAKSLDPGWEDAVPYNSDDDCLCSDIFAAQLQAGHSKVKARKPSLTWARELVASPVAAGPG